MIYLIGFVSLVLATARLTRVFNIDEIAAPLRDWILRRWPAPSKPTKLVACYWCSAVWTALLTCLWTHSSLIFAGWLQPKTALLFPIAWFAVAYAASWVLDKEQEN